MEIDRGYPFKRGLSRCNKCRVVYERFLIFRARKAMVSKSCRKCCSFLNMQPFPKEPQELRPAPEAEGIIHLSSQSQEDDMVIKRPTHDEKEVFA